MCLGPNRPLSFPQLYTAQYLEQRRQAVVKQGTWKGLNATEPKCPTGHARGMQINQGLTSGYRETRRKGAMDIKPQNVVDVLTAAGVKKWVLTGLHGYVGYLPQPRTTQDVDVLISHHERKRAVKAVRRA